MSSFTPGPWEAQKVDSQQWEINAPHGDPYLGYSSWKCFASVYGSGDDKAKGRVRVEENARLIAAAPELLEALKLVVDTFDNGGWPSATIVIAKAAIAKAEDSDATE